MSEAPDQVLAIKKERDNYAHALAQLNARFEEKVEELSLVRQFSDALGSSLDLITICRHTVDVLQETLGPENCSVMLLGDDSALYLVAARGAYDEDAATYEPAAQAPSFALGEGIAGQVVESRTTIRIDDTSVDERFVPRPDSTILPLSLLCVPLLSRDKVVGVINLSDSIEAAFESNHERILALVNNAVGMAMENALLFAEVTRSRENLAHENKTLKRQLSDRFSVGGLIGNSAPFRRALQLVEKVADTIANILITGESGTGKEVFARTLHFSSSRKDGPFIAVNCAALPESLLEAELFGIKKGVATGVDARAGTFERAHGGTLFLDEIGDMSAAMQVRLLRVLQERQVVRVGSDAPIDVDVRVVSATHRDLAERISDGVFREDLFYRLKVVSIELPSLRERREDILPLALHFASRFAARHGRPNRDFSRSAARALLDHKWPGNVRELEHTVEQAILLSDGADIEPLDLGLERSTSTGIRVDLPDHLGEYHETMEEIQTLAEQVMVTRALAETNGNRTQAAALLGIARRTLNYKLKRHDIS
jgi:transcriptional regulator with GAF, ATPase, and Fis domain